MESNLHTPNIDNIIEENPFFGYVNSVERALDVVRDYENATTSKFTVYSKSKNFGAAGKFGGIARQYLKLFYCLEQIKILVKIDRMPLQYTLYMKCRFMFLWYAHVRCQNVYNRVEEKTLYVIFMNRNNMIGTVSIYIVTYITLNANGM